MLLGPRVCPRWLSAGLLVVTVRTCLHTCLHMPGPPERLVLYQPANGTGKEIPGRGKEHPCPLPAQDLCFLQLIAVQFIELTLENTDI